MLYIIKMILLVIFIVSLSFNILLSKKNKKLLKILEKEDEDLQEKSGEVLEEENIESTITKNMLEFSDTNVKEIMTARTSIFAIEKNNKISDIIDEVVENGFSRIPIYEESIDNIVGILYIKDILKENKDSLVSKYMKEAFYIPETKLISKLLEEFRKNHKHMAIIIDEYGGTAGLVSIEDILEEIVGEIRDEYDVEVDDVIKISDNIYEIQGDTLVEQVNLDVDVNIPISEEYDTISGYTQYISGRVPILNDQITLDDFVIKIVELENKRIKKVKLILLKNGGNDND